LDEGISPEDDKDGFHVHRIKFKRRSLRGFSYFTYFVLLNIKKINPDIVHSQSIGNGVYGLFAKILLKKKYIIWGRGSDVYRPDSFTKLISFIVMKKASCIIALTENMKKEMTKSYDKDIIVIPNGINLDIFKNYANNKSSNFEKKCKKILFVGRLQNVKGVTYLIEAMNIITKHYDVTLLIVGEGEDREKLEALVKKLELNNFVSFVGKAPRSEIPKYMAESDIFILPSISEGFPLVLLEAMASGLTVVASNVGGIPEIIEDGVNGLLTKPMNSIDLADKVLHVLCDDKLRERISSNNKKCIEKYDWGQITLQLEGVYMNIKRDELTKGNSRHVASKI
jgi:glycosyltransferase involved in cell wall biosynthesis